MAAGDFLSSIEFISPAEFAKKKIQSVQDYSILAAQSVINLFRQPHYWADTTQQMDLIGFGSLQIVLASVFFTGAALALNSATTLSRFGATTVIGQLVSIGIVRELGPVLAGLVVAGRNSSGMASELGSMIVTEQIDAMRALGTDPLKKLVTPRVLATVVMLFFLTILGGTIGFRLIRVFLCSSAALLPPRLTSPSRSTSARSSCRWWRRRASSWPESTL